MIKAFLLLQLLLVVSVFSFYSVPEVYATSFYSSTADGCVTHTGTVWSTVRDATNGSSVSDTSQWGIFTESSYSDPTYTVSRAFFYFDTSSIGSGDIVISATLEFHGVTYLSGSVTPYLGTQAGSLTTEDFNSFSGNPLSADYYDCYYWTVGLSGRYNDFTFNQTGLDAINKTGVTKICLINYNHDALDSAPTIVKQIGGSYQEAPTEGNRPYLTVVHVPEAPTIGEFSASSTVHGNEPFYLDVYIRDGSGVADFVNATVQLSGNIILLWDNATDVYSEHSDTNGYYTLLAGSNTVSVNSTAYKLRFYGKLNSYDYTTVQIVVTNTKVFDSSGDSGTGSDSDVFTYSQGYSRYWLVYDTRSSGVNVLDYKTMNVKGTMANGTSFNYSATDGNVTGSICYGTVSYRIWHGSYTTHGSDQSSSITSDGGLNTYTSFTRFDSGSYYIFGIVNKTGGGRLLFQLIGSHDWKIETYTITSGETVLMLDYATWMMSEEPYSFTIDGSTYARREGNWNWEVTTSVWTWPLSNAFTGYHDFSMSWEEPQSDLVVYFAPSPIPTEDTLLETLTPELLEVPEDNILTSSPYIGIGILLVVMAFTAFYSGLAKSSRGFLSFKWKGIKTPKFNWGRTKLAKVKQRKTKVEKPKYKRKKSF